MNNNGQLRWMLSNTDTENLIFRAMNTKKRSLPCNELSAFGTFYGRAVSQEQLHDHLILDLEAKQDCFAFLRKQAKEVLNTSASEI